VIPVPLIHSRAIFSRSAAEMILRPLGKGLAFGTAFRVGKLGAKWAQN
jgi:hypothetical protein